MWKMRAIINNIDNITAFYNNLMAKNQITIEEYLILSEGWRAYARRINDCNVILNDEETDIALEKIYTLITKMEIKIEEVEDTLCT